MKIARTLSLAALMIAATPLAAHEGHDHGAPAPAPTTVIAPRAESASTDFELVAVVESRRLVIYLDGFATNEPIAGAKLEVESGPHRAQLKQTAPGTYEAEAGWLEPGKRHDLVVSVEAGNTSDLLPVTLDIPAAQPSAVPAGAAAAVVQYVLWGAGVALAVALLVAIVAGRKRRANAAAALAALLILAVDDRVARAHEGHDHGPQAPPPTVTQPARLPDGSVFVPKPSQRVLGLRTTPAERSMASATVELNGHVIADPNGAGRVQSPQPGRIEPAARGLPHLGTTVARGEVLAYVVPTVSALDAANQKAQIAGLAAELDLAQKRHARLIQLEGSVPARDIEAAANAVRALEQRRAAVSEGLGARIALVAPIAGRVSAVAAAPGQVVDARDTLFEVVDPARLLVEALAYDPKLPGQLRSAVAVTTDGRSIEVSLIGYSAALREHALPVAFRIGRAVEGLAVGQPVRVLARVGEPRAAVLVPAQAVVKDSAGGAAIWVHPQAERFVLKRVRVSPVDATRVAVLEGVEPNERVVTLGASLLGQVR